MDKKDKRLDASKKEEKKLTKNIQGNNTGNIVDEENNNIDTKNTAEKTISKAELEEMLDPTRDVQGISKKIIFIIAITMSLFHLYTAGFGLLLSAIQRSYHLMFVFALGFLLYPASKNSSKTKIPFYDWVLVAVGIAVTYYIPNNYEQLIRRGGLPTQIDVVMGVLCILLVLELTRRAVGIALPLIAMGFLLYGHYGYIIPGRLGHIGYSVRRLVNQMYMTTEGIFGTPLGVSATFVFMFILFGSFLEITGVGQFFIDIAFAAAGHMRGGPAKAAVIASGFMGSISGSSVANTVTTGNFTIPLMKKVGYNRNFAGAVEAAASTGGQILPPVMGAAAFIMSEFTGIAYIKIIISAAIPALLYYAGVLTMVHLEACKQGLKGLQKKELPNFKKIFKDGFHLILPIVALLYFLVIYSPLRAAFLAIGLSILCSLLRKHTRIKFTDLFIALEDGARKAIGVAVACACAGIIVGVVTLTGLGLAFGGVIVRLASGMLLPTLILTMLASIILGIGLPTTPKYIILATMAVPAIISFGVPMLAAHLFVLYFGVLADVTPPVALAAYAGAGIAGGNQVKTGLIALKLAMAGFIVPFVFAIKPTMLLVNVTFFDAALAVVTAFIGVVGLGAAVEGYLITYTRIHDRLLLLLSSLTLLFPGIASDIGGFIFFGLVILIQNKRVKDEKLKNNPAPIA